MEKVILLEEALILEKQGKIKIYNPNVIKGVFDSFSSNNEWKSNFLSLRDKYRKIPLYKLYSFIMFDYKIEYKIINDDQESIEWVYMYGKLMDGVIRLDEANSKGKYVYVLTNIAYPNFCKIGKAVSPSNRVKQINGAGTVSEWKLRYALPVNDGYILESLVHEKLKIFRRNSHQGSSREFFEISVEKAIEVIEELGESFAISKPIYY